MANKNTLTTHDNVICKYDDYLEPSPKKTLYEIPFVNPTKKRTVHKQRLSSLMPPPPPNKTQQSILEPLNEINTQQTFDSLQKNNPTLLSRKNYDQRKQQIVRLEKLFPKNVTIKFQEFHTNNRKMSNKSKSPKIGKTISPFKVFEMAENRFYVELFNQKQRQEQEEREKQSARNTIDPLFNVRSIKMIKKISQNPPYKEEKVRNNLAALVDEKKAKSKYEKMFKKENEFSVEFEKQNPPKDYSQNSNFKLSLANIRRFEELQKPLKSSKSQMKFAELQPLSELQNRQEKNKERLIGKKAFLMTEHKAQGVNSGSQAINRSTSMLTGKRKVSRQMMPTVFSINNESLNSTAMNNQSKVFDGRIMPRKCESIFEAKISKYQAMLKMNAGILGIDILFPETYSRNQFCFFVGKGNNSKLVKQMLKKRWWLGACEQKKDLHKNNVIWTQLKDKAYYLLNESTAKTDSAKDPVLSLTESNKQSKQPAEQPKRLIIHNHFEQNEFLGNKKALFYNMKAYYEIKQKNVFDYLPLTFHITSFSDQSWNSFVTQFKNIKSKDATAKNIWILKPGQNSNRGNGITVHESIESIRSSMNQGGMNQGADRQKSARTFILQKYIQKPFLYNKRKFDIRCYMLLVRVNQTIKGFWYKEGYIRTSGYEYTLEDCDNSFVHLTNDAIQQHCQNYGKYQDKNKLSYDSFQKYLDANYNSRGDGERKYDLEKHIIPKLRTVCIDSIKACSKSIGKWRDRLPTFELFGLDFMIDDQFNPWLIEINTNPCLQTEGRVLQKVIVSLLDNVFKLTVDCLIPPPLNWSNSNKHLLSKNCDNNLFELVYNEATEIKSSQKVQDSKNLPMHMIGEIDEDNEVYEDEE